MTPEEQDDGSDTDLPSFEDIVERLNQGEGREDAPASDAELDDLIGDLAGEVDSFDESKWEWGGHGSAADPPDSTAEDPFDGPGEAAPDVGDRLVSDSKSEALLELIDGASNVLLLGPVESSVEYDLCTTLCETGGYPRRRVLVTTTQSADERLNALRGFDDDPFDETTVIAVDEQIRSSGNGDPTAYAVGSETVTIETISFPRDLTRLGLLVNKHLGIPADGPAPVVCFHTLSTLLESAPVEKVFRFLHVLQGRVRMGGARAHYHLDPDDHPDEVINTLRPIFDFTVRFDADGRLRVET
ncbi:MAG: hypothetical protein U5J98_04155 [Halobacteriales archaeon]|nr:hypothetical protein [Halobacteriales archaeon]